MTPIINDASEIRESFEETVILVAIAQKLLTIIVAATFKNSNVVVPIEKLAGETVRKEIDESVKNLVLATLFFPPSDSDLLSKKSHKDRKIRNTGEDSYYT